MRNYGNCKIEVLRAHVRVLDAGDHQNQSINNESVGVSLCGPVASFLLEPLKQE